MFGLGLKDKILGLGLEAQVLGLSLAASDHGLGLTTQGLDLGLVHCGLVISQLIIVNRQVQLRIKHKNNINENQAATVT